MTHICVGKRTIIGSDNGLSLGQRQAIIWANAGTLLIWPLGTNFSEILIEIYTFSLKKMHLKTSSGKWRPFFSLCLNGLNYIYAILDLLSPRNKSHIFVEFVKQSLVCTPAYEDILISYIQETPIFGYQVVKWNSSFVYAIQPLQRGHLRKSSHFHNARDSIMYSLMPWYCNHQIKLISEYNTYNHIVSTCHPHNTVDFLYNAAPFCKILHW